MSVAYGGPSGGATAAAASNSIDMVVRVWKVEVVVVYRTVDTAGK